MPVENRSGEIGDVETCLCLSIEDSFVELASQIRAYDDVADLTCVVVGDGTREHASLGGPTAGTVAASLAPMTDAIKRVDGPVVIETVDREQLIVVGSPLVLPIDLARRWAVSVSVPLSVSDGEASDLGSAQRRRSTATALLSQLVLIEPDLRIVGLDQIS